MGRAKPVIKQSSFASYTPGSKAGLRVSVLMAFSALKPAIQVSVAARATASIVMAANAAP
jgi:hypothetical protein